LSTHLIDVCYSFLLDDDCSIFKRSIISAVISVATIEIIALFLIIRNNFLEGKVESSRRMGRTHVNTTIVDIGRYGIVAHSLPKFSVCSWSSIPAEQSRCLVGIKTVMWEAAEYCCYS
jgi:hypothetical protein